MLRTLIALFITANFTAGIAAENSAKPHHVILITIDGAAAFYFDDPKAPLLNLRKLAAEGVVAKGMKVSNPSVTWPNHTTLITGVSPAKHSVLYNGLMLPDKNGALQRDPERSQTELVAVPTVYDFLHKKGFSTAGINWPCTKDAAALDYTFPDVQNQLRYTTPQLIQELTAAKILDDSSEAAFINKSGTKRDEIWAEAAGYVLQKHRPNFMLLHFLFADGTQHRFGPQTTEAYEALDSIDQHIGKLF
ncbi:MAG: ectonucleotide pyrophosphatase/phosphodiesterase, partial [Verrucomicrobiota bacterium]